MKRNFVMRGLWLALLGGACLHMAAQAGMGQDRRRMSHQMTALFVARAEARKVVPPVRSNAKATGAFTLETKGRKARLEYDLTFDGLQNGPARAIRLYNFGEGANGKVVYVICGPEEGAKPCPAAAGGTVSGVWTSEDRRALTPELVHELTSQRIYVEIGSGPRSLPEIRSQLKQQTFMGMTRSFVSRLGRDGATREGMSGTAAFDFVRISEQRSIILFDLTVAGLRSPITAVNITLPSGQEISLTLPISAANRKSRSTVSGQLDTRQLPQLKRSGFIERLGSGEFSVSITTADQRARTLRGKLTPLH